MEMATSSTREELEALDERINEYFYKQNLKFAEKLRKYSITIRDTVETRSSGPRDPKGGPVHGPMPGFGLPWRGILEITEG
jgi:hypothetical protein